MEILWIYLLDFLRLEELILNSAWHKHTQDTDNYRRAIYRSIELQKIDFSRQHRCRVFRFIQLLWAHSPSPGILFCFIFLESNTRTVPDASINGQRWKIDMVRSHRRRTKCAARNGQRVAYMAIDATRLHWDIKCKTFLWLLHFKLL